MEYVIEMTEVCVFCGREFDPRDPAPECEEPDRYRKVCWSDEDHREAAGK